MTRLRQNTETISISLPSWMLELLDETCHRHDCPRSYFIKKAVKQHLLKSNDTPELWEELYNRLTQK